ncbi:hypothetical protein CRD36_11210 [Paremcibacter congregatus]|uniref:Crp/Fnr family transcriptional regulator n=1 Tax=Paremcibacter congregatus TaxID=2043170 RepID=A0A2G4YPY6_9PROT|nr:hypothetical protein CRD36_11210 [Paremcibacter congregatus]QDE28597.1 cyclic nucleotide-binding domain-containing protein [Paremcibacter congregatus]
MGYKKKHFTPTVSIARYKAIKSPQEQHSVNNFSYLATDAAKSTSPDFHRDANGACDGCAIRHVSLCNVLDTQELGTLSKISTDHRKSAKQIICSEDDPADHLFNIHTGVVRLSKMLPDGRRQVTGFLFPGDFFGLSCGDLYSFTAEAVTEVDLCRFSRPKLRAIFRDIPKLGERVLDMTRTELDASHARMLLLGRKTAREKLSTFLLDMVKKNALTPNGAADETSDNQGLLIDLPMSRTDIADFLGLTIETVSRQFSLLHKAGHIELDGAHRVFLKDPDQLSALAEGL